MKRHRALVPFSHDHHHALVQARRLRDAADDAKSHITAAAFLRFFAAENVRHFRDEEESLFPFIVAFDEARNPLVRALLEHQRLHALAAQLEACLRDAEAIEAPMRELGTLLETHIRFEEREFFPLIERLLGDPGLTALPVREADSGGARDVPVWGLESEELNATLLRWGPGDGPPEHVNEERDVLVAILEGSAAVTFAGEERRLDPGEAIIVDKGLVRRITAGPDGVRYLSVHRRRSRLQIIS